VCDASCAWVDCDMAARWHPWLSAALVLGSYGRHGGIATVAAEAIASDDYLTRWAAAVKDNPLPEPFMPPSSADEWYTVTIADVSVGYMHTTVTTMEETVGTMEVMDVQVSRGTDTSRMAFETVFTETALEAAAPEVAPAAEVLSGGVRVMAYDQRFANSEVRMNVSFANDAVTLTSYNGEKEHVSAITLPEEPWLGRMRARLEFARQCRAGATHITVQTMRPELGPRIVNLSSTLTGIEQVWDGEAYVDASTWTVQISDVPVNMSEAYPISGPLRCYRMLQMGLDMPFGYLLASLSSQSAALVAAEVDPDRKLPELVYTMFVPLSRAIPDVYEARMVKLRVKMKGTKGTNTLSLPAGGFQAVELVDDEATHLLVTIDLQAPQRATDAELADSEYMSPSAMVDSSDEVIIELAHKGDADLRRMGYRIPKWRKGQPAAALSPNAKLELVYVLRDLVQSHISSKHLSTAYASASETARTGSGDCTEHAVLLAALLKARGIPARVCHGLVYVEQGGNAISGEAGADATESATVSADGTTEAGVTTGQFGWHMWSQALVDGRWLDLDATLHVPFSVGHVLVGTSSMSDKEAHNNHMQMAALIGNLEVDLLDVSHEWSRNSAYASNKP